MSKGLDSSRYKAIASDGEPLFPPPGTAYLHLDSNLLIDMEKGARGRLPDEVLDDLRTTVSSLWYQNYTASVAVTELCWNGPRGSYRRDRHVSLLATLDAWLDCRDPIDLVPDALYHRYSLAVPKHEKDQELQILDVREMTMGIYCSLLKLASLAYKVNGFKASQRLVLLEEYCHYVGEELELVSAYALQVAMDYIVAEPTRSAYTKRLLKFGKDVLKDLWGAAWDLMYLTMSDYLNAGGNANPFRLRTAIMSADSAMLSLRQHLWHVTSVAYYTRENMRTLTASHVSIDQRLRSREAEILALRDGLTKQTLRRAVTHDPGGHPISRLTAKVALLEAEVVSEALRDQSRRKRAMGTGQL